MQAEPRPRQLGRVSEQVREYIAMASEVVVDEISWIFDCFESGEPDCWEMIPQTWLPAAAQFGRMVVLLTSGDILVWRDFPDRPDLYAVFYIGPGNHFV